VVSVCDTTTHVPLAAAGVEQVPASAIFVEVVVVLVVVVVVLVVVVVVVVHWVLSCCSIPAIRSNIITSEFLG